MARLSAGHEAIVIGAGPGGLAAAACLKNAGIKTLLLERGEDVATTWRNGYDRLRINTSSWFSHLPGRRFPRQAGRWIARDELVAYYRDYVRISCDANSGGFPMMHSESRAGTPRELGRCRQPIPAHAHGGRSQRDRPPHSRRRGSDALRRRRQGADNRLRRFRLGGTRRPHFHGRGRPASRAIPHCLQTARVSSPKR
jgi:phytoene dehydrogenase-like protein